jgi:hypothetical protein
LAGHDGPSQDIFGGEFRTSGSPKHEMKTVFVLESEMKGLPCLAGQSLFHPGLHIVRGRARAFGLDTDEHTHTSLENRVPSNPSSHIVDTTQTSRLGHTKTPAR